MFCKFISHTWASNDANCDAYEEPGRYRIQQWNRENDGVGNADQESDKTSDTDWFLNDFWDQSRTVELAKTFGGGELSNVCGLFCHEFSYS